MYLTDWLDSIGVAYSLKRASKGFVFTLGGSVSDGILSIESPSAKGSSEYQAQARFISEYSDFFICSGRKTHFIDSSHLRGKLFLTSKK